MAERMVLDGAVTAAQVADLARAKGWILDREIPAAESPPVPYEIIWRTADGQACIHYVEDWVLGLKYLRFTGPDPGNAAAFAGALLPTLGREDLRREVRQAQQPAQLIDALYLAAALAPEATDAEILGYLKGGMDHADPRVRKAAVFATAYAPWRFFEPTLERLAAQDADAGTRELAATMLDSHRRHAWR